MKELIKQLIENLKEDNNLKWHTCRSFNFVNFQFGKKYIVVDEDKTFIKLIDDNGEIVCKCKNEI